MLTELTPWTRDQNYKTLPFTRAWRDLANCPIENYANNKIINRLQFSALTRFWMGRAECKQTPHFGILIRRGGLLCNILTYKTLSSNWLLLIKWWASICQSQCRCRGRKVRAFTIFNVNPNRKLTQNHHQIWQKDGWHEFRKLRHHSFWHKIFGQHLLT